MKGIVPETSTTLLRDISSDAGNARWPEFVARYHPSMFEIQMERPRKIVIEGPGRIEASISGVKGVEIELGKHAALINLTDKPHTKSGIQYILCGACYLNFKNLDKPGSDLKNIWVNDRNGKGCPIIRFRGHPDTYDEAAKEQKKIAIELMKKSQLDWI